MSEFIVPKISVIVPVFNAETYLRKSLTSLMEQTFNEAQFIIIDDGSTDDSYQIITEVLSFYPDRSRNTTLITRENLGVSLTRSEGLALALGEYVIHMDSDDWVDRYWLENLYIKATEENADVVICDFKFVNKTSEIIFEQLQASNNIDCLKNLLIGKISNSNCDKLVRRDLFLRYEIDFASGLNMGEDFYVTFKSLFFANKIVFIRKSLYYYNKINVNSLTKNYTLTALADLVKLTNMIANFINESNYANDLNFSFDVFKLNVKNCHFDGVFKSTESVKNAINLYPETNYLVKTDYATRSLKVANALNRMKLIYLYKIFDVFKFCKNFFKKLKNS